MIAEEASNPKTSVPSGTLFLVVGPSGAGKDTLIGAARQELGGDGAYYFVRRVITRPADAGGEDYESVTDAEFDRRERSGRFALSWSSHGLRYGIPREIDDELRSGRHVVANVSRTVIADAENNYASVCVLLVTADHDTLAKRLAARGRETKAEIAERLARAPTFDVGAGRVVRIDNSGDLGAAATQFIDALLAV